MVPTSASGSPNVHMSQSNTATARPGSSGLTIMFFPMIILSWTVERMSILWEEEGWREVAIQGSGSLITAIAAYLAMTSPVIRHLSFNFIGLQFVALALIMMIGSYSGYRLLELRRFGAMTEKP